MGSVNSCVDFLSFSSVNFVIPISSICSFRTTYLDLLKEGKPTPDTSLANLANFFSKIEKNCLGCTLIGLWSVSSSLMVL